MCSRHQNMGSTIMVGNWGRVGQGLWMVRNIVIIRQVVEDEARVTMMGSRRKNVGLGLKEIFRHLRFESGGNVIEWGRCDVVRNGCDILRHRCDVSVWVCW